MKKIILLFIICLSAATFAAAQQNPALPNDPDVKTGKLDNGMTYYIRHNPLPEGRAEFYLATNVGAIQETPDQDGLAHFLEHMCFNGLKNLPGKDMLNYLQRIGAEFGRNINASTGVEHTQYMLNNIPVTREGILDTCLLVMHDYSHFVLNEPSEIDAERGVILEEKRTRNSAGWRMFEKSAPYIYGDTKYAHCNIIGSEENLKTFKPSSLKTFYETWYRPDMQAIIIVGDIDVEKVYAKVVKLFADIPAPTTPTIKNMPEVVPNDSTVVGILTDPENNTTDVEFIWKLGRPMPKEMEGTVMGYAQAIIKKLISGVMQERLQDIFSKPDAPFTGAHLYIGKLCESCETIFGSIQCENSAKTPEAIRAYLIEVEKAKRFGFTDDEFKRVKESIIKGLKNKVAGASTRKNPEFIHQLIGNFFDGTPYMSPETELKIAETLCGQFNADMINQIMAGLLKEEHLTVIYSGIDKEGQVHPTEKEILDIVADVKNADIKANVAEAVSTDFMEGVKLKGAKVGTTAAAIYGSQMWVLKNGLKVIVLPTEYKKNQVLFNLRKEGGLSLIPTKDLASFDNSIQNTFAYNQGIYKFPNTTVSKMLTGKTVSVSSYIESSTSGVSGSCAPEDIETALQLVSLNFLKPRFDQSEWDVSINQLKSVIPNMESTPDYAFGKKVYEDVFASPRKTVISTKTIEDASLAQYKKYYETLFKDAAGATMIIVGNIDEQSLKPLVEKYLGSLPKGRKAAKVNIDNVVTPAPGSLTDVFKAKMTTPKASVMQIWSGTTTYSVQKYVDFKAAEFILDRIYVETLREEEGGTYGASASADLKYAPVQTMTLQVYFDTNVQQQESLRNCAVSGLEQLALNGPTEEQLTSAIENAKKNLPEKRITNNWWMNAIRYNVITGGDWDKEYEKAVGNISAEGIKAVLNELLSQKNFKEIVMLPEE